MLVHDAFNISWKDSKYYSFRTMMLVNIYVHDRRDAFNLSWKDVSKVLFVSKHDACKYICP